MDAAQFQQLLYEEESATLDFKRDQYAFVKASEDDKSELLKDILGFVNGWRRTDAFIVIGVQEVQGGKSIVCGVSEHLQDHSLQQFVNNMTNRPVQFGYEALEFEGKQVGIIRIEIQRRPVFLKRDYGRLKREKAYVRRGTSTDPTRPADPDEIALMRSPQVSVEKEASLAVEFAASDREQSLGTQIDWLAEFCDMPESQEIPNLGDAPAPIRLLGGQMVQMPSIPALDFHNRLNRRYYHELSNHTFFHRLFRKVRLVVLNTGDAHAADVRLEICVPNGRGFAVLTESRIPDTPRRKEAPFGIAAIRSLNVLPTHPQPGYVSIDKNDHETKVEIECGNLQPGRKVWTDVFYMGIGQSGDIRLAGDLFAANLSQPQTFALSIKANVKRSKMTVDELVSLDDPNDDED
jgi:hypothetical protein